MSLRIKLIQTLININEKVFFYPKLKKTYRKIINNSTPLIIDVGANKGQSINFFLNINKHAKIIAFEPNQKLYNRLIRKYDNSNLRFEPLGVSHKTGELLFNENVLDETSSFESLNKDSKYLKKKAKILGVSQSEIISSRYKVNVVSLSDYLNEHKIKKIDVLKIDVEGHELKCLQGLFSNLTTKIEYIQLESHHDDMYLNNNTSEIETILNKNGFEKYAEIKHGFGDFSEIIYTSKTI